MMDLQWPGAKAKETQNVKRETDVFCGFTMMTIKYFVHPRKIVVHLEDTQQRIDNSNLKYSQCPAVVMELGLIRKMGIISTSMLLRLWQSTCKTL